MFKGKRECEYKNNRLISLNVDHDNIYKTSI